MTSNIVVNKEIDMYRSLTHKVKLRKLYEQLKITPNKAQDLFIDDIDNNYDKYYFFTSTLGRRSGKSVKAAMAVVRELMIPYASVLIVAPSANLTDIIFTEVKQRLSELGMKPDTINNQSRKLTFEHGSTLICVSANSPEQAVGKRYSLVCVDESALSEDIENILTLQILPATTDYGLQANGMPYARVLLFSTPRGKNNYHYRQHLRGVLGERGFRSYNFPSTVNPIVTQEFLDKMKENMDEYVYRQEYMAEFLSVTNSNILYSFNENEHLFEFEQIAPYVPLNATIVGIDVGFRDASAHVMVLKDRSNYFVYSAVALQQADTKSIVELFSGTESTFNANIENRYCDRTAAMFANDAVSLYDYGTFPSQSDIRLGFALLNQLLREGKLKIERRLIDLIQQMVSVEWSDGKTNTIKRTNGHHQDLLMALRYAIYTDYVMSGGNDVIVL